MPSSVELNSATSAVSPPRAHPEPDRHAASPADAYVFNDSGSEEHDRLRLLAGLLDPMHRSALRRAGIGPGQSCLEVGAGAGTLSAWMADQVVPDGHVVAADLNVSFLGGLADHPHVTVRKLDVLDTPLPDAAFDLITARALLHHLPAWENALARLAAALKPTGTLVLVEPDASVGIANDDEVQRRYWSAWCRWGTSVGVDFTLGGKLPNSLPRAGLEATDVRMELPYYRGGSPWADLYLRTLRAAGPRLGTSIDPELIVAFTAASADPSRWMTSLGWTVVVARRTVRSRGGPRGVPGRRTAFPGARR
ncbi:methyltransferase domain-containing protein [Streptomyces sp. NPDC004610]|uniref:class I SAM-dependent methyltransferase n=1 Tax=unclassified Streptomyces TaxID=2593676 RepID=UPI0033AD2EE9